MVGEQNPFFFLFTVFQPRTIHAPFQHWLQILVLKKNRRLHKRRDVIFFLPFNSFFVVYILDYQNDFVILLAFFFLPHCDIILVFSPSIFRQFETSLFRMQNMFMMFDGKSWCATLVLCPNVVSFSFELGSFFSGRHHEFA